MDLVKTQAVKLNIFTDIFLGNGLQEIYHLSAEVRVKERRQFNKCENEIIFDEQFMGQKSYNIGKRTEYLVPKL